MHRYRLSILLIGASLCTGALAHPGHGATLAGGLLHPLTGVDHLLAMLGIGIWASLQSGRSRWLIPASFLALMIIGAAIGVTGHAPLMTELGVAASVAAIGMLIFCSVRLAPAAAMCVASAFALFHGCAHGSEMASAGAWSFGAGVLASSAALQSVGFLLGGFMRRDARIAAISGAGIAACGTLLVLQAL